MQQVGRFMALGRRKIIIVTTNTTALATTITPVWFIKLQIGLKINCLKSMLQE